MFKGKMGADGKTTPVDAASLAKKLRQKQEELAMLQTANEALQAQSKMSNERADAMEGMAGDKEMALAVTKKALDTVSTRLANAETIAKDAAVVVETAAASEASAHEKATELEQKLNDRTTQLAALRSSSGEQIGGLMSERSELIKKSNANADRVDELAKELEMIRNDSAAAAKVSSKLAVDLETLKTENANLVSSLKEWEGAGVGGGGTKGKPSSSKASAKEITNLKGDLEKANAELAASARRVKQLMNETHELGEMSVLAKQQVTLIQAAEEKAVTEGEALRLEVGELKLELKQALAEIQKTKEDAGATPISASKISENDDTTVTTSREEFKALQNELGTLRESLQDANALQETTSKKLALASKNAAGALADLASAKNYVKSLLTEKALSESRRENHVADAKRAAQQTEDVENEMQKLKKDHLLDLEASAAAVTAEFQAEIAELSQKAGQGQNNASSSSSSSSALQTALDRACDAERSLETTKKRADTLKAALDEANQMAALANERASDAASTAANAVAKAREAQTSAEQEAADARASEERARALSLRNAETEDSRDSKFADLEARLGEAVSQAATARGDASAAREGEAEALRLSVAAEENCVRAAEEARVSKHAAAAATAQATTAEEARRRAQLRCEEAETAAAAAIAAAAIATETTAITRIELETAVEAAESRAVEAEAAEAVAVAAAAAAEAGRALSTQGDSIDSERTPTSSPYRGTPGSSPRGDHDVADLTAKTAAALASRDAEKVNFEKRMFAKEAATRRAESAATSSLQRCVRLEEQLAAAELSARSASVAAERAANDAEEARARAAATTTTLDSLQLETQRVEEKLQVAQNSVHQNASAKANLEDALASATAESARVAASSKLAEEKHKREVSGLHETVDALRNRLEDETQSAERRIDTIHGQHDSRNAELSSVKEKVLVLEAELKRVEVTREDEKAESQSLLDLADGKVSELEISLRRVEETLVESRAETWSVTRTAERARDAQSDTNELASKTIGKLRAEVASLKSEIEGWGETRRGIEESARTAQAQAVAAISQASAAAEACAEATRARDTAVESSKEAQAEAKRTTERSEQLAVELKTSAKAAYESAKSEREMADALRRLESGENAAESVRKGAEGAATKYVGTEIEALRRRLEQAHLSVQRAAEDAALSAAATAEAEKRRHAAQSETAKLAGERRTATARASSLELEVCEANKCVKTLERSLAESNSTNDDLRLKLQDATGLRKDAERRFEETREALRSARGDAASASAACVEMERRMASSHRAAAEASMRLKVGTASRELVAARLRDAEAELAKRAAEGFASSLASRDFTAATQNALRDANQAKEAAESRYEQAKEETGKLRKELCKVTEQRAVACGRLADTEVGSAKLADRCARLTKRLYPHGGAPSFETDSDLENSETSEPGPKITEQLIVLRATLQGHPIGHDLDVTASVRRRLRSGGDTRLRISIAENLKEDLFGDEFPQVDASRDSENDPMEGNENSLAPEGRLVIEYSVSGKYYGNDSAVSSSSSPRGGLATATLPIGGVCTNAPFPVTSLVLDAVPAAADQQLKDATVRARDAERVAADSRARLAVVQSVVGELRDALSESTNACQTFERRNFTLAETARAATHETYEKAHELKRVEQEALRAISVAESARERARRAVNDARDEARKTVEKAVRDERARYTQKTREVRLASAQTRRRNVGGVFGEDAADVSTNNKSAGATPGNAISTKKGTWGVPKSRDPAGFAVSSFLRKGELAAQNSAKSGDSPIDAAYKYGKKASAAATMEAEAWADAKAAAAREVSDEVNAARLRFKASPRVFVTDTKRRSADLNVETETVTWDDDDGEAFSEASFVPTDLSDALSKLPSPSAGEEARRRAESRVRLFQKREREGLERRRRSMASSMTTTPSSATTPPNLHNPDQSQVVDLPLFTPSERRFAFVEKSATARLKLAEEALSNSETENTQLRQKAARASDADAFDEELRLVRRRAAGEVLRTQAEKDKGADADDATTLAKRLMKQSEHTLSGGR